MSDKIKETKVILDYLVNNKLINDSNPWQKFIVLSNLINIKKLLNENCCMERKMLDEFLKHEDTKLGQLNIELVKMRSDSRIYKSKITDKTNPIFEISIDESSEYDFNNYARPIMFTDINFWVD